MKKSSKFFSILLAFAMVFGILTSLKSEAYAPNTYDIVVTKMLVSDISQWKTGGTLETNEPNAGYRKGLGSSYYTGGEITNLADYFGQNKTLDGVYFELHKNTVDGEIVSQGTTGPNGRLELKDIPEGTYWLVENKAKSNINVTGEEKKELAGIAAVPMEIKLPVYKKDGTTFTTIYENNALHVYPKNTIEEPTIKKVVNENDTNDTALIGQDKTFKIESVMPDGIESYKKLLFTDQLDAGLTYTNNLKITKTANGTNNAVEIPNSSYTLDPSTVSAEGIKKAKITIDFKEDYIKTLKKGDKITIKYTAKINEDAILGKANENEVILKYGNNPSHLKEKKPDKPEIHTGGIRFIKEDGDTRAKLGKAKFIVFDEKKEKVLKQTKDNAGKVIKNEWVDKSTIDGKTPAEIISGNLATVFESKEGTGEFEIVGLPYGRPNQKANEADPTTYYCKEIEAPVGYALLPNEIEFNISSTSYYKDPTAINHEPTDPKIVSNYKITIPQTGGIGSVVVVVGGIMLIGFGILIKRKYSNR